MTEPSIAVSAGPGRRCLLGGLFALAATQRLLAAAPTGRIVGVPPDGRLLFDVFRNDSQIGTHRLTFQTAGSALTVHIAVDFKVGLGPIALFRYTMDTTEQWQGGRLVSATSTVDNDGKPESMSARLQGGALAVHGSKSGDYVAPPGAILATHWNRAELKGPMINPENGELMHFTIVDKGSEQLKVGETSIAATHYALTGPATIDLWYDNASVWSGLRAVATDNSTIDYRLSLGHQQS